MQKKKSINKMFLTIIGILLAIIFVACIFRKNRALAPHERSAVPLGTDHCPVC